MTGSVQPSSTLSSGDFGETIFIQRSYYWRQPKQHQSVGQFSAWADMVRAPGDPARWRAGTFDSAPGCYAINATAWICDTLLCKYRSHLSWCVMITG